MKITIINTSESGGAAYASINLFKGLQSIGVDVNYLTLSIIDKEKKSFINRIIQWWQVRYNVKRNHKFLKNPPKGFDYFTLSRTGYRNIHKHPLVKNSDLINIHWINNMVDYPTFFKNIKKPIIWTLHDTNPFTGGCHYTFGCNFYLQNCSPCMQLNIKFRNDVAKNNLQLKYETVNTLSNTKTVIVSPSRWLKDLAENSLIYRKYKHYLVPYGIDTDIFKSYNLIASRKKYNLPLNKFIVLFVATSINEYRKGFDVILKLNEFFRDQQDILFLNVGDNKNNNVTQKILNLGYLKSKSDIAIAYNAADVFVIPSREDNLPNTMLESLCCGTPVIGFKTGGIVDVIKHGTNGFLVEKENVYDFAQHIQIMVKNNSFDRNAIEQDAKKNYSLTQQASKYKLIIDEIL